MKLLIVVDMQNDFIDGALGTPEAQAIVPKVAEKIKQRLNEDYLIVATMDTHFENYLNTQEGRKLPILHCIEGTDGHKINSTVRAAAPAIRKYRKSTFGLWNWQELVTIDLYELWQDTHDDVDMFLWDTDVEVEFVGVCTDICVISNVLGFKAAHPEAHITVDASCCAGSTPERHKYALEVMKSCQIDIINE